nr:MAG TPA: Large Terminase [Caudoviricetes sp.]
MAKKQTDPREARQKLLLRMQREAKKLLELGEREYLKQYCKLILTGKIVACQKIKMLCAVLLDKLLHPEKHAPYVFNLNTANHAIDFVERFCKQPVGKLGAPLRLELFQLARWQAIFGFVHQDTGLRQYLECMIVEGRKNGKTTEIAALELALLIADGEGAPEIYNIATKREQAAKAFDACVNMRQQSPEIANVIKKRKQDLYFSANMGFIRVLASSTNSLDGLNAHGILIDELAAIKNRQIYDDMKQSQSAREQPLLFSISTNGFVRENIFDAQYEYAAGVLDGTIDDPTFLPWIYELDDREEYLNEKMWIKANPGLGTIKKLDFLRRMVKKAKSDPSFLPTVLVKDFNLKENADTAWLTWAECSNPAYWSLPFRYCIGGFDAADSIDLTAATALCMRPDDPHIYRQSMYWIPQSVLDHDAQSGNRRERDGLPYSLWVKQGFMRTHPGNKVDKQVILDWFLELRETKNLYVLYIGYDPWHIDDSLLARFKAEFGERCMIPVRQGALTLSQPMYDLKADLRAGHLVDNNNPIDKICLINTNSRSDVNGNIQPVKTTDPRRRIDGTVALLCCYKVLNDNLDEILRMNEGVD